MADGPKWGKIGPKRAKKGTGAIFPFCCHLWATFFGFRAVGHFLFFPFFGFWPVSHSVPAQPDSQDKMLDRHALVGMGGEDAGMGRCGEVGGVGGRGG